MNSKNVVLTFFISLFICFNVQASENYEKNAFFTINKVLTYLSSSAVGFILCYFFCKKSIILFDNAIVNFHCDIDNMHINDGTNSRGNAILFSTVVNGEVIATNRSTVNM